MRVGLLSSARPPLAFASECSASECNCVWGGVGGWVGGVMRVGCASTEVLERMCGPSREKNEYSESEPTLEVRVHVNTRNPASWSRSCVKGYGRSGTGWLKSALPECCHRGRIPACLGSKSNAE